MNILIPMAGLGKRFLDAGFKKQKPLIDVLGKPMICQAIESLDIEGKYIFIIRKDESQKDLKQILKKLKPSCCIIEIDYLTKGAACTCLIAKSLINSSKPLIITNCDQIMEWKSEEFLKECNKEINGVVVTYKENTPKNSYVMINKEGFATKFAEKEVISNHSLNGIHYWKKGSDFVNSAEKMIKKNIRVNNEFYIAPTYNQMIKENKKITIYEIERKSHHPVGTPEDLRKYENFKNGKYD